MWCNMMKSTKSQKASVLHYSIDIDIDLNSLVRMDQQKVHMHTLQ